MCIVLSKLNGFVKGILLDEALRREGDLHVELPLISKADYVAATPVVPDCQTDLVLVD